MWLGVVDEKGGRVVRIRAGMCRYYSSKVCSSDGAAAEEHAVASAGQRFG